MNLANLTNVEKVGENDHGYEFYVGQLGELWQGFAVGQVSESERMIFFLPSCGEMDLEYSAKDIDSRAEIIKRTGAIAQSQEHGYGGIKKWFVDESLRGRPEDYACRECGSIGCTPEDHIDDIDFPEILEL